MTLPLEGVRIVSVEQYGAGPFGTLHLADMGAEVIKIENPGSGGDIGRYVPPYQDGEDSLFFESFNRNKLSVSLDITKPSGRRIFEDLVKKSDAVFSNLRGDVPKKLKIQYEDLRPINPAIVCCSLSGFGMEGPRAGEPAYDYIFQAIAGWMSLTGEPDGPPTKSGLSLVDYSAGLVGAVALLGGILSARQTGIGMDCDLSLFDTAISMLTYVGTWFATMGHQPQRMANSAHPSLVPFQAFQSSDGWLVIGCAKEKFWRRLIRALEAPDLESDPRFSDFTHRNAHRGELTLRLGEIFGTRPTAFWIDKLKASGVPCAPVNSVAEALADEQTHARGLLLETDHPRWGTVRSLASPVRVGKPRTANKRAPFFNEDANYVLDELLGYSESEISDFSRLGAFGSQDWATP